MMFGTKPTVSTNEEKINELLTRGVAEALPTSEGLKKDLLKGGALRIKLGVDPTGTKLHIGHSVPLLKLRDFQELGHKVVFIVGDFTAVIGDTSDKDAERPMLSPDDIRANMKTWKAQVGKILDLSKTEFRYNSEWLGKLTYQEIGEHADVFSVSDFIARDNIKRRLDAGKRVSLREVLYPLMQGYDSVAIKADVELGGSDQRFNLLAGRALQERFGQKPQHVLTCALITDASGKKISKTGAATVYLTDSADEMFGKIMSIPDELAEQYFISMTRVPLEEVKKLLAGHPKEAKIALAEAVVRLYHSGGDAEKAKENFEKTFSKREVTPDMVEEALFNPGQTYTDAIVFGGFRSSRTEVRRLASTSSILSITRDEKITDANTEPQDGEIIRVGPRQFIKLTKNDK